MQLITREMFELQQVLQDRIEKEHNITIEETKDLRILALLVELGECANETRSFKYWSTKNSSPKSVVLEEFVDGIHFLLAIGIDNGYTPDVIAFEKSDSNDISRQFLQVYKDVCKLHDGFTKEDYETCFSNYLQLLPMLGIDVSEVFDAYVSKNKENHHRQDINY